MTVDKSKTQEARRGFLRRAAQTGVLAGAAAVGAAGGDSQVLPQAGKPAREDKRGYRQTHHVREYYRTSGIF